MNLHAVALSRAFAVLLAGCLGADPAVSAAAETVVPVTITDQGCTPASLTVPAGRTSFRIRNASQRAVEWEILDGVMVVDERENIIPGLVQTLTTRLKPGTYQITCGLLSNPKGTLTVIAAGAAAGPATDTGLAQAITAYHAYVLHQAGALVAHTRQLVAAVQQGALRQAQQLYAPSRIYYERIEPIAELFSDLDSSIDARADDFETREKDPRWRGFHRIEYALFQQQTTQGAAPVAAQLLADVEALQQRLQSLRIPPKAMVGGAADLIEEVAATKISGEEDRYSHSDLWDFQANVDGAQKIVDLLRTPLQRRDPALLQRIDGNFAAVQAMLAHYRDGDGFVSYVTVTRNEREHLRGPVTALAEDLSRLRGTLGLD